MSFACSQRWLCQWYVSQICIVWTYFVRHMLLNYHIFISWDTPSPSQEPFGLLLFLVGGIPINPSFGFGGASQPQKKTTRRHEESPRRGLQAMGLVDECQGDFPGGTAITHDGFPWDGPRRVYLLIHGWLIFDGKYEGKVCQSHGSYGSCHFTISYKVSIWVCGKWCSRPSLDLMEPLGRKPLLLLMIYPAVVGQGCRIEQ